MRVWHNAVLNFVITSIDVGVNPAVEKDKSFSFRNLHEKCKTPVKQQNYCPACNKVADTIVRGFEFPKGSFIPVTDVEVAATYPTVKNLIDIQKFVEADMLNPLLFRDPYWLIPSEHKYATAYAAFKAVMLASGVIGLGSVAFTDKEHPCALEANEEGFILWLLNRPVNVRVPDWDLPLPDDQAIKMAEILVKELREPVEETDFDVPTLALQAKLREDKTAGIAIEPVEQSEARAIPDVLVSIQESVKIVQERKKAKSKAKVPAGKRA